MLSSGMIPSHRPLAPARRGLPAQVGAPVRPRASSVLSVPSAFSVFIPALRSKNASFVFIRLRTLPFSVHNIVRPNLFAFNPFRTLSEKHGGGMGLIPFWSSPLACPPWRATTARSPAFHWSLATGRRSLPLINPLEAILTNLPRNAPRSGAVTPLEAILTDTLFLSPLEAHSYEKQRVGGSI